MFEKWEEMHVNRERNFAKFNTSNVPTYCTHNATLVVGTTTFCKFSSTLSVITCMVAVILNQYFKVVVMAYY